MVSLESKKNLTWDNNFYILSKITYTRHPEQKKHFGSIIPLYIHFNKADGQSPAFCLSNLNTLIHFYTF